MLDVDPEPDGKVIFDHSPEEIGLHVMENHDIILACITSQRRAAAISNLQKAQIAHPDDLCPRCEGATIYISRDVLTGQEVEISCLYCNETGRISSAQTAPQPDPRDAEIVRLRLDVEKEQALQDSAYRAGLKAGWNMCVNDDHDGYAKATESTEHIAELRRIREARAALAKSEGRTNG